MGRADTVKETTYYESSIINLYPFVRIKDHEYDQRTKILQNTSNIFIGAKILDQGGFVNLMRIKANYYSKI